MLRRLFLGLALVGCASEHEAPQPAVVDAAPSCPAGTARSAGACIAVGVRDCGSGFSADGAGGCAPVLPESCAAGLTATPGDMACRSVGECVDPGGDGLFVDAAKGDDANDGSKSAPVATIGAALARHPPRIVVGKGTYAGALTIDSAVTIVGRCAEEVVIAAPPSSLVTVTANAALDLSGVTIGGDGGSVLAFSAQSGESSLRNVRIRGHQVGIQSTATSGRLRISDVLIEDAQSGLGAEGAPIEAEKLVIRGGERGLETRGPTKLVGSVIESTSDVGILAEGTSLSLERTVVRTTLGIRASNAASVRIVQSVISNTIGVGVQGDGGALTLDRTTILDTKEMGTPLSAGVGVLHGCALSIVDSAIERCALMGVIALTSGFTMERSVVLDVGGPRGGYGIAHVFGSAPSTLSSVRVEGARMVGVFVAGSTMTASGVSVHHTTPDPSGKYGDSITVTSSKTATDVLPGSLELDDVDIDDSARAGISVFAASLKVKNATIRCSAFPLELSDKLIREDGVPVGTGTPVADDLGGNVCGCTGVLDACHAEQTALDPIALPVH
ncbi:MAG: hypothetical protein ACXVEF_05835 [Polyangiales bacterium]